MERERREREDWPQRTRRCEISHLLEWFDPWMQLHVAGFAPPQGSPQTHSAMLPNNHTTTNHSPSSVAQQEKNNNNENLNIACCPAKFSLSFSHFTLSHISKSPDKHAQSFSICAQWECTVCCSVHTCVRHSSCAMERWTQPTLYIGYLRGSPNASWLVPS